MSDELEILRSENLSLKKDVLRLESELEKRTEALNEKTAKCENVSSNLKSKNLKLQEVKTKNQRQSLKFERKIAELKDEISELKRNTNPSIAEIMAQAAEQLNKAKLIAKNKHSYTPETPNYTEEDSEKLETLRAKFNEFSVKDDKANT